jgi:hypothetical protein
MRLRIRPLVVTLVAVGALACGGSPTADASLDAGVDAFARDAARRDAAREDANDIDAPIPEPPDAAPFDADDHDSGPCAPEPLTADCVYAGYGTECTVPCAFPRTCSFAIQVTWAGGHYCCGGFEGSYVDCVCEDGRALCREPDLGWRPPRSTCEFCERPDAGH